MKPALTLIVLLLIADFSIAQKREVSYNDGGLSLMVDKKWKIREENGKITLYQILNPENLNISKARFENMSLDEIYEKYITESFPSTFKNYYKIEEGTKMIDGKEFRWIHFNSTNQGMVLENIGYYCINNGDFIMFTASTSKARSNSQIINDFNIIVESVRFNK